jgi:hypothetical protein
MIPACVLSNNYCSVDDQVDFGVVCPLGETRCCDQSVKKFTFFTVLPPSIAQIRR